MSLARAFTTRRNRTDKPSFIGRTASQRSPSKNVRPQISGPINLISSTNVLAFEAPDILGTVPTPLAHEENHNPFSSASSSSSSSRDSGEHSDASSTSMRSRGNYTDASSIDESPSAEPNHLSCYFKPSVYTDSPSRSNSMRSSARTSLDAPTIPQRAASHSKKAHFHVSRQRSISRLQSPPTTAHEFNTRESSDCYRAEPSHPFGKELEQLNEVAEEFGSVARDAEAEADLVFMEAHGLGYFCATDYMMEIGDALNTVFEDEEYAPVEQAGWI